MQFKPGDTVYFDWRGDRVHGIVSGQDSLGYVWGRWTYPDGTVDLDGCMSSGIVVLVKRQGIQRNLPDWF